MVEGGGTVGATNNYQQIFVLIAKIKVQYRYMDD
jgi:hypothetical protein